MPTCRVRAEASEEAWNLLHEITANICNIIENSQAQYIIFGGDLNVNLKTDTSHARVINEFLRTYCLMPANNVEPCGNIKATDYTFSNEKLNQFSTIDYLCISSV